MGNYSLIEKDNGGLIKDCSECLIPHKNPERIIAVLFGQLEEVNVKHDSIKISKVNILLMEKKEEIKKMRAGIKELVFEIEALEYLLENNRKLIELGRSGKDN